MIPGTGKRGEKMDRGRGRETEEGRESKEARDREGVEKNEAHMKGRGKREEIKFKRK